MFGVRRLRGLIGFALVWGGAVSAIGTAYVFAGLATGLIPHLPDVGWTQWVALAARVAARNFLLGGAIGAAFAMLLTGAERRRSVDTLSLWRVGGWGFLASAVPTVLAVGIMSGAMVPVATLATGTIAAGIVGVGLSVGMVRLARRGSARAIAPSPIGDGEPASV